MRAYQRLVIILLITVPGLFYFKIAPIQKCSFSRPMGLTPFLKLHSKQKLNPIDK